MARKFMPTSQSIPSYAKLSKLPSLMVLHVAPISLNISELPHSDSLDPFLRSAKANALAAAVTASLIPFPDLNS